MHPRIQELIQYLDAQRAGLRAAFDAVPREARDRSPAPGRWSAANVIEHLAIVEQGVSHRLTSRIAEARAEGLGPETNDDPVLPTLPLSRLLDRTTRFAAREGVLPTGMPADAAWASLEAAGAALRDALKSGDGLALGTLTMPHPRLGEMSLYYFVAFIGAHEARHAEQIREITQNV
ncbi:MAG TPA: DinB family protein [Casimicrobiaceae bacterium]|nr:DinB family protein [Casimicrobiaceae bacterium]